MAEAFADHPWVLADREQVCGVGVAEAVEGEVADLEAPDETDEPLGDVVWVLQGTDDGREHVAGPAPTVPDELGCVALLAPMLPEDVGGPVVDVDDSARAASISAIERSVESDRRRVFTVQEVVAFALTFDVPFLWFLIPPPDIGLRLEGLDGPIAQLWRIAIGTNEQADQILGRLAAFAEANPEAANEVAETALGFEPGVTMEHYQQVRLDSLIDMVTEELDSLDELFGEMSRLVDRYNETSTRFTLNSDAPRRAYRQTSEVLLGRKVWELINAEYGRKSPGLSLLELVDRDDVPWESLIDTDRPAVRDAVLKFVEAIEPELRDYMRAGSTDNSV